MAAYDPKSMDANAFINHEEILATLAEAQGEAQDPAVVRAILDKAAAYGGLTHREAAVLLEVQDPGDPGGDLRPGPRRSRSTSTAAASSCSPRSTSPTTASTAAPTAATTATTASRGASSPRRSWPRRCACWRAWGTSAWRWRPARTRSTARSTTSWSASRPSTPSSSRTAPSAGSTSTSPPPRSRTTASSRTPASAPTSSSRRPTTSPPTWQVHPGGPKHNYEWHTEAHDRAMTGRHRRRGRWACSTACTTGSTTPSAC